MRLVRWIDKARLAGGAYDLAIWYYKQANDKLSAYKFLLVAEVFGGDMSKPKQALAGELTSEHMAKAQHQAEQWLEGIGLRLKLSQRPQASAQSSPRPGKPPLAPPPRLNGAVPGCRVPQSPEP